jgi:tRNA(Ile)-lysidine synthase
MARSRRSVDDAVGAALAAPGRPVAPGPLDPDNSPADLPALTDPARPIAVAFSGGLDSSVLLHAVARLAGPSRVLALHVHHGLQPAADGWVGHCAAQAAALGVAFGALRAQGAPARNDSVEQWARGERYRLLLRAARDAHAAVLVTAHHADDQLETVLLALARGCGLDGLTGIAARDTREGVTLLRPLLPVTRDALHAYAQAHGIAWIEDPSNADDSLARNAVRHRLLPTIRAVLPELSAQLPDTIALLAQARATLDALAAEDLARARRPQDAGGAASLHRPALAALPAARQAAALRAWLVGLGARPPTRAKLDALRGQLVLGQGAQGDVGHDGWRLLRYRDRLFALREDAVPAPLAPVTLRWRGEDAIALPGAGRIEFGRVAQGLPEPWLRAQALEVAPASSSARLRTLAGAPSRTLKNLWQEGGLPAWLRRAMPSVSVEGRLLMVAPFGPDRDARWPSASPGIQVGWRPTRVDDPRRLFCAMHNEPRPPL